MPKLSKDALEKRFICQYCGESVRTRQGLSGHIQFKHSAGEKPEPPDWQYILSRGLHYEEVAKPAGEPVSEIRVKQHVLADWLKVQGFCEFLKLKLTAEDFKNFIVYHLAHALANETLKAGMLKDVDSLLQQHFGHLVDQ